MIPRVIHYCWFGNNPLPDDVKVYLESWKKYLPGYEICEWNEKNFDISQNAYVKEAYEAKKWAFITDYVRLYALYNCGGIYMDTDVEVLRNLDCFLSLSGFSGFEREDAVPTGIMAAEKGHEFIGDLLKDYDETHFIQENGEMDLTTNVVRITSKAVEMGLALDNTEQVICDFTFFPKDYFCPKSSRTGEINITDNTYTIHHFAGSWINKKTLRNRIKAALPVFVRKWVVVLMDKFRR